MFRTNDMKPETLRDSVARVTLTPAGTSQAFVVARPLAAGQTDEVYRQVSDLLARQGLAVVHERAFGAHAAHAEVQASRRRRLAGSDQWPLTFIEIPPLDGGDLAGVQIQAVSRGAGARTVFDGDQPRGRAWSDGETDFLILQALHGLEAGADRPAQARRMIRCAERLLRLQKASYRNVARTWIYLHRILDWYGPFNLARNEEYARLGVMADLSGEHRLLPSSTGIEGGNPLGAACVMDLLAVADTKSPQRLAVTQMANRRQQDAFRYGSAFSRATHIPLPGGEIIHLSGTAAIDEAGRSLHVDDARAQIEATLDIAGALLGQRGMGVKDLASATLFLKRGQDLDCLRQVLDRRGLADLPAVYVQTDVCRADLLFEIDGVAARCR